MHKMEIQGLELVGSLAGFRGGDFWVDNKIWYEPVLLEKISKMNDNQVYHHLPPGVSWSTPEGQIYLSRDTRNSDVLILLL